MSFLPAKMKKKIHFHTQKKKKKKILSFCESTGVGYFIFEMSTGTFYKVVCKSVHVEIYCNSLVLAVCTFVSSSV